MRVDAAALSAALAQGGAIQVVNYHNTPAALTHVYAAEFARMAERFAPCAEDDLAEYLVTGRWRRRRPGIIPAFFNGYRNNHDVALPLLESHGLIGWFFAVPAFSSCPATRQADFAAGRTLRLVPGEYPDGRHALSWDELRDLDRRGHVVASHTRTHSRVVEHDADRLEHEIVGAQDDFEEGLGHRVRSFAWLHGGRFGDNPAADAAVLRAGHEFLFATFHVQRLPRSA